MRRFGICGRSSFQSDQLQAACCGERFCAGAKKTDGFTRNPRRALTRLNTEKLNTVNRRARASEIVERQPRSGGSLGQKYEVRRAAMSAYDPKRTVSAFGGNRPCRHAPISA